MAWIGKKPADTIQSAQTLADGTVTPAKLLQAGPFALPANLTGGGGVVNFGSGQFYKDASGNVGIGTGSPANFGAGYTNTQINGVTGSFLSLAVNGTRTGYMYSDASGTEVGNLTNGYYRFIVNGSERARIDPSGNLLVGTTSAFSSIGISFSVGTTSGGMQLGGNGTQGYYGTIYPSSRGIEHSNAASAGSPRAYYFTTQSGGAYTSLNASAFNISSDYRLKENIQPLTGALDRLSLLKPSRFNYRADIETKMPYGGNTVDGFVAHEVFDVVPEAVSGEKDALYDDGTINPQSLDASKLVPLLTAAIQEQQAIITAQATQIQQLREKVLEVEEGTSNMLVENTNNLYETITALTARVAAVEAAA